MRKSGVGLFFLLITATSSTAQGTIQTPGQIQVPKGTIQTPGEIRVPKGTIQTPGEIQVPRGTWQVPGEIQVPKGIQAVKTIESSACERRLSVVGDALFDFDKAALRIDAEETLVAALPEIKKLGSKPALVEGHTDAVGSDSYNQKLSEARAKTVRDWLSQRGASPPATAIKGYGKAKPIAANATEDGKDYPEGRQKNRRVEVVFDSCR
jgi:outer membrane protein OmpA-like peptidoglycan-associated protein